MTARHRFELQLKRSILRSLVVRIRMTRQVRPHVAIRLRYGNTRWGIGAIQWLPL